MILPDVAEWSDARHGWATTKDGVLKVAEEAGEVAAAWNKGEPLWRLGEELADVIIAACTTAHLAGIDLPAELEDRWAEVRDR